MAKKNYTKAGAKRAMMACRSKVIKVWEDGYISGNTMQKLTVMLEREAKAIPGRNP